ncbi:MAG: serine hydrolase domain-containing protein [Bacteroidota bacterium]
MNLKVVLIFMLFIFSSCQQKKKIVRTVKNTEIKTTEIDKFICKALDSSNLVGVSVSITNDNRIVYSGHFGTKRANGDQIVNNETIYEVASLSKPVFSFFVLKQVEKGILDLDVPLYNYLPNSDIAYDDRYKKITARMVLCHSTGFPNWRPKTTDSLKLNFKPGSRYGYSGEGYEYLKNVLSHLLETDDKGLDGVFLKEVAKPLGIENFSFTWLEKYENKKAFGHINGKPTDNTYQKAQPFFNEQGPNLFASSYSLYSTSDNYARFLIALNQKEILDDKTFDELLRPQTEMPIFPDTETHRSLFSFTKKTPDGLRYFHTGANRDFQSWTHLYPEKGFGIVILTNGDNLFSSGFAENLLIFLQESVGKKE